MKRAFIQLSRARRDGGAVLVDIGPDPYFGQPGNLREQYKNEPWFALAETFTDVWDQAAFDPAYKVLPLEEFEPLVRQFFGAFKM